jgi:hypothetical protein
MKSILFWKSLYSGPSSTKGTSRVWLTKQVYGTADPSEAVCRIEVTDRQTDRQTDVGSYSCQAKNRVPKWEKNEKVNTNTRMLNPLSHFCSIHRGLPFLCNHKDSEESGSLLARPYLYLSTCFIYKIDEKNNITGSSLYLATIFDHFPPLVYRVCRLSSE